jgi:hypothetical protein
MGVRGMREWGGVVVFATCSCLIFCVVGGNVFSSVVDIFNVTAGTWSTAALSQARGYLAATSLPDAGVAIFAGGQCTSCDGLFGVLRDGYECEVDARVGGVWLCLRRVRVSCLVQLAVVATPILWTSST